MEATRQRSSRGSPLLPRGSPTSFQRTSEAVTGSASGGIGGVARVFGEPVPGGGRAADPAGDAELISSFLPPFC